MKEILVEFTIPLYIREYVKSKNIRPKYYQEGDKIPKSFHKENEKYAWRKFNVTESGKKVERNFLVDKITGERIVSNPHLAGKEKKVNINGQGIYNGNIKEHDRANMIGQIKDCFRPHIQKLPVITRFPIFIEVELYDKVIDDIYSKGQDWDIDNRFFPYAKSLSDILKAEGKIPDDDRFYITKPPHCIFHPVPDDEDRKLEVFIYKDNRESILNNYLYQRKHGTNLK